MGLLTDYWGHVHLSAGSGDRQSIQFRGDVWPDDGFLERNYRYKSLATRIPQDIGFAPNLKIRKQIPTPQRSKQRRSRSTKVKA